MESLSGHLREPIDNELVLDIDLLALNPQSAGDLECLYLLTRESMLKSGLYAYHDHLQATDGARKRVAKTAGKMLRIRKDKEDDGSSAVDESVFQPGERRVIVERAEE
ncbi:MAG: hypothetical protein ACJ74H_11125 [Thermoanaerobaculia bacterium]